MLKESTFLTNYSLALRDLGIEKTVKVLSASLAICAYAVKNGRILELFFHMSFNRDYQGTLFNNVWLLQHFHDSITLEWEQMPFEMNVRIASAAQLYLEALVLYSWQEKLKKMSVMKT